MQTKKTKGATCPKTEIGNKSDGQPRLRRPGAGRKRKVAGRLRGAFTASVDTLAIAEINRRASLAGQTVNDWLSDTFAPAIDSLPDKAL